MATDPKSHFTDKHVVKELYKLMYHVHNILVGAGILYYASGGTLLGAVRHRGIINWDNDIDLEIGHHDLEKVLSKDLKQQFKKVGYRVIYHPEGWVKIIKIGDRRIDCDLFPVEFTGKDPKTKWVFQVGVDTWPKCYHLLSDLFPLKEYTFGKIKVLGPKNPAPMLGRCYGPDWKKKGYITQDPNHHELLPEKILVKSTDFTAAPDFYIPSKPQIAASKLYKMGLATSFT